MKPSKGLQTILEKFTSPERYLFTIDDFAAIFPDNTIDSMRMLLSRATQSGLLKRVCRGLYLYPKAGYDPSLVLYHAAARLRADAFCYVSLESVLSESGLISQQPLAWISLMTNGRSGVISCGNFGTIEFIKTTRALAEFEGMVRYDPRRRLWVAGVELALKDMSYTKRPLSLVDRSMQYDAL